MKNEVIHARISEDIKKESETILNNIGMTLSQSIDLFLRQVVLKRGIPFELNDISNKKDDIEDLAYIINSVDGNEPPVEANKLIHLYSLGYTDSETANFGIVRLFKNG